METLLGMSLLLQVLVLIQIMRFGQLVLQQMKKIENGKVELQEATAIGRNHSEPENSEVHILSKYEVDMNAQNAQKKDRVAKKEEQEVLISEVLSEFF